MLATIRFATIIFAALLALNSSIFTASTALAAPELKVGFVDLQKALLSSKEGKAVRAKLESEYSTRQKDLDRKKSDLARRTKDYNKQRDSLNARARGEKEEELMKLERDLKRSFRDAQEELRRRQSTDFKDLIVKLRKIVDQVGREQGFTIILESGQGVLYADNKIDITESVVARFDALK